jgi:hypothetical protein
MNHIERAGKWQVAAAGYRDRLAGRPGHRATNPHGRTDHAELPDSSTMKRWFFPLAAMLCGAGSTIGAAKADVALDTFWILESLNWRMVGQVFSVLRLESPE